MLPNLKFLVCGILFCVLLFAVTGAGVMRPDSRTHIGEMPEIGRPMMQQSMAEVPSRAHAYMMTVARHSDELARVREPSPLETAPAPPEPDLPKPDRPDPDLSRTNLPKPDAVANAPADGDAKTANPTPDGSPQEGGAMFIHAPPVPPAESRSEDPTDEASPPRQVAVLAPAAAEESEPVPRFANVPLPTPRPTALGGLRRQGHIFHRRQRLAQPHDAATQGQAVPLTQTAPMTPGVATGNAVFSPR